MFTDCHVRNSIYLGCAEKHPGHLFHLTRAFARHFNQGLSIRIQGQYLQLLNQPAPCTQNELEYLTGILKKLRNDTSQKNEIASIQKFRRTILSGIKIDDQTLITKLNSGQIKLKELLKGFTAEEALQWILENPAADALEVADFRGFTMANLNNDCLDKLTAACPNLKTLFLGGIRGITGDALKYLERLPKLKNLCISELFQLDPDSGKHLQYVPELETLKAKYSKAAKSIMDNLIHVQKLKRLNVSKTEIETLDNCVALPDLIDLNIGGCKKLQPDSLKHLKGHSVLTSLNISGCHSLDGNCLENLIHTPNLQKLKLKLCWNLHPNALENLMAVPRLKSLILHTCPSLAPGSLMNLIAVPDLLELSLNNCSQLVAGSLNFAGYTSLLQKLCLSYCELESKPFEPLKLIPNLQLLDFSHCLDIDPYALQPLLSHSHLQITHNSATIIDREQLPLALKREMLAPLNDMNDWGNFIIRDSNWDMLDLYNNTGTQEPYGRRMQQAIVIVTDLIKSKASFQEVYNCACNLRHMIAIELDHGRAVQSGRPRTHLYTTDIKQRIYNVVGTTWKKNHYAIQNSKAPYPFYNPAKSQVIGYIHGKKFELSYVNFDTMALYHTHPDLIDEMMVYVEELYNQAEKETDPAKVQELAGLFFWWFCQTKPVQRGEPSIGEIIFRALFASKQIPNLPWKQEIVPWGEATIAFDPTPFSQSFHTFFEK